MKSLLENRVDRAARLMRIDKLYPPKAARKVLDAEGIRNGPNKDRLVRDICSELGKRGSRVRIARAKQNLEPKAPISFQLELKV